MLAVLQHAFLNLVQTVDNDYQYFFAASELDECLVNNGGCSDTCTDTAESYVCSCPTGYLLDSDAHTCSGKKLVQV